jgi:arginine-tRNA-protein transferase
MQSKKGWEPNEVDIQDYYRSYVSGGNEFGKELLYFIEDKLVAVALLDILSDGISSIYCYYDHDYEKLSLGKYSILAQISIAKQKAIPYLYLGYWIKDHFSMGYKEAYKPFEILVNRPNLDEEPIYKPYI